VNITQDRLITLAEAAAALSGELDLDSVLEVIIEASARVTGARYAALGVIGPDQSISRFITYGADEETIQAIGHYPTGKGLLGLLIRDPRIIRLDDISEHPASYGFPEHHPPMGSFLGAPVSSGGTVYGNLYLTEKPGGFLPHDEQLIQVLAAQAGAAIENALLSEQLQSLAVHEERERISRELHDGVIQALFSIGMGLESARTLMHRHPDRAEERVNAAIDGIDGAIRELRNYIFQLRPHHAAAMGLARGIVELGREFEVNALVRPTLDVQSGIDARVPAGMVPDLLQVVRELLSNCAKHASASTVIIAAEVSDGAVTVAVTDDGTGFVVGSGQQVGRGLENVRERVEALDGRLSITSEPGQGTRVALAAPLPPEAQ
jgi:signal transduction histidine kinase